MKVKDWLNEAKVALDEIGLVDDKPLLDYAGVCALVEIAYQLRCIANHLQGENDRARLTAADLRQ